MKSLWKLMGEFRSFIVEQADDLFFVYSGYRKTGSTLIKNKSDNNRILIKPWYTKHSIGRTKIEEFIHSNHTFKGHQVDNYVFIGKKFKDISKQYAKKEDSVTLVEFNIDSKKINIFGSANLNVSFLNLFIEFGDSSLYEISYDFEGILKHQGFSDGKSQVDIIERKTSNPIAFISYSWDNEAHKLWVLKLSYDLINSGVDVLIDEWDLRNYKDDLNYFMESGIRDSNHVIMICTPTYAKKANKRTGGVGVESTIITGEFFESIKAEKYIPIIRDYKRNIKESLPSYLKSRYAIDFKNDAHYTQKLEELLRKIFNKPRYRRPTLGDIPDLKTEELGKSRNLLFSKNGQKKKAKTNDIATLKGEVGYTHLLNALPKMEEFWHIHAHNQHEFKEAIRLSEMIREQDRNDVTINPKYWYGLYKLIGWIGAYNARRFDIFKKELKSYLEKLNNEIGCGFHLE